MTLHGAIIEILKENGPMTSAQIASVINKRKLYVRKDEAKIRASQIAARINKYPIIFKRESGKILLKDDDNEKPKQKIIESPISHPKGQAVKTKHAIKKSVPHQHMDSWERRARDGIKWSGGITLIIIGISKFSISVYGASLAFLAGVLLIPPIFKPFEKNFINNISKSFMYVLLIIISFVGFLLITYNEEEQEKILETETFAKLPKYSQDSIIAIRDSISSRRDSIKLANSQVEDRIIENQRIHRENEILAKQKQDELIEEEKEKEKRKEVLQKQFSLYDGSHIGLTNYIKNNMNDPVSYDHIDTRFWDYEDYLIIVTRYRGNNVFGGKVVSFIKAKVDMKGNVLEIRDEE